ncbi:MAG: ribonuclease E/G, partial [Thermoanaerobaculia bacterium]
MSLKMLIESDPHQTRIAVLEDDRLTEIFVERHRHRGLVGNVYKGRVTRVLPGMQAAFVDVGLERDAFLYVSDVAADVESMEDGLEIDEARPGDDLNNHAPATVSPSIDDLLKAGQEIIVQVVKDPLPNKGARISTHVTLPGRYLVLLPTVRHFGVSRRIEDEAERERLLAILHQLPVTGGGLIVRTAGEGKGSEEFENDLLYLSRLWEKIRQRAGRVSAPTLLHQDLDLALRTVRDLLRQDFAVLWVDGEETYERIVEFLDQVQPALISKVKLFRQRATLFEQFGIEEQIEAALKSKVWLKSGGYIVINPTEALVAIDVNTGRFVGQSNLEDTVLHTNLEAVQEIVRQIRLRDLGGIIVIDLIDMIEQEHREQVFSALEGELRRDRAKTKVLNISE